MGIPLITAKNVKDGFLSFQGSQEFIPFELYSDWMVRGLPEVGDVMVTTEAPLGNVAQIVDSNVALAQRLILLKTYSGIIHNDYLKYYFMSLSGKSELFSQATGSTAEGIKASKFKGILLCVPSLLEQKQIADYLDRETQKIDALITAKKRLLELLVEKRRSLITHMVTHGLDADAPMKDSGVEWLGKIPENWQVISLSFLAQVKTGVTKGRDLGSAETVRVPYLRVANVQDGYVDLEDVADIEVLPEEVASFSLKKGDVLMNEGGDADKLGRGAVWKGAIEPCLHQNHVFAVRCYGVEPEWLSTVTSSSYAKAYFESRAKQSTNLASISSTNLKELPVILPPREMQIQIVNILRNSLAKLDALCNAANTTIALLQERRTSLISAAVTGQLKIAD
ncbi:MAG: restriction endonuclease subunit S [Cyanosarcina radialis HA8281-LM2]|nr:restriction endonuclease subunit S [Cyanosarcina radialis HA8281-LM2]